MSSFPRSVRTHWIDQLKFAVYDFNKGQHIPMHQHDKATTHITIVTNGSVVVKHRDGEGDEIVKPGGCVVFDEGVFHEIIALEDETRIYNLCTHYNPDDKTDGV